MRRIDRIGEIGINHQGCKMEIVEYNNANDLTIKFLEYDNSFVKSRYNKFNKGNVDNPFYPTVQGIGYIGYTNASKNGKHKESYNVWRDMLSRCYNKREQSKKPSYIGCEVCEEWLCFETFEKWYNENYYNLENEPLNLDKDILFSNNKIYSPKTCLLVPKRINQLFIRINFNHKSAELKYKMPYKEYKENKIREVVSQYKK